MARDENANNIPCTDLKIILFRISMCKTHFCMNTLLYFFPYIFSCNSVWTLE